MSFKRAFLAFAFAPDPCNNRRNQAKKKNLNKLNLELIFYFFLFENWHTAVISSCMSHRYIYILYFLSFGERLIIRLMLGLALARGFVYPTPLKKNKLSTKKSIASKRLCRSMYFRWSIWAHCCNNSLWFECLPGSRNKAECRSRFPISVRSFTSSFSAAVKFPMKWSKFTVQRLKATANRMLIHSEKSRQPAN